MQTTSKTRHPSKIVRHLHSTPITNDISAVIWHKLPTIEPLGSVFQRSAMSNHHVHIGSRLQKLDGL